MIAPAGLCAPPERATEDEELSDQFPWPMVLRPDNEPPWVIKGEVVDSSGQPIHNAHIALVARLHTMDPPYLPPQVLGQTETGTAGEFLARIPRLPWYQCQALMVIANGAGYGVSARHLDVALEEHDVLFRLEDENPVHGILSRPDGHPAAGIQVILRSVSEESSDPRYTESATSSWPPAARPLAWPAPAITDDQGRFTLGGIRRRPGAKVHLSFQIDDPRFGPEVFTSTVGGDLEEQITHQLLPAFNMEGMVVCQDTGDPMSNAWLLVVSNPHSFSRGADTQIGGVQAKTDARGRFQVRLHPGKFVTVFVYPSAGKPYPAWMEQQAWPEGEVRHEIKVTVPRGVLVRGKAVELESGEAVAGVGIEYHPRFDYDNPRFEGRNAYFSTMTGRQVYWAAERRRVVTASDGSFEIGVLPGVGFLLAKAPTPEFISRAVTLGELQWDERVAFYFCTEGLLKLDPKPGTEPLEVTVPLRRGITIRGSVEGPQGEAVDQAVLLSPSYSVLYINPPSVLPIPLRNGRFELPGYDLREPQRVFFFDAQSQWGASRVFDAEEALREPPTVRLEPCGSATVVFVDQDNRPWANQLLFDWRSRPLAFVQVVGIPAAPYDDYILTANPTDIGWAIRELAPAQRQDLRTDAEGRVTLTGLIPGAPHKLYVYAFGEGRQIWRAAKEFTAKPEENLDLGTVVVKRPPETRNE